MSISSTVYRTPGLKIRTSRMARTKRACLILIGLVFGLSANLAHAETFGIRLKDKSTVAVAAPYACKTGRVGKATQCTDVKSSPTDGGQRSTSLEARYYSPQQVLGSSLTREPDSDERKALGTIVALVIAKSANDSLASERNVKVLDARAVNILKANVPDGFDGCAEFDIDVLLLKTNLGHQARADRSGAVCVKYDGRRKRFAAVFLNVNVVRATSKTGNQFPQRAAGLSRDADRVMASLRNY